MTAPDAGLVAGRFHVLGLLGTGGTAVVYRARDDVTGEVVALKLSHPHADAGRIHAEASALGRVEHPNVVRVVDSGDLADGRAWIALELVEGVSLAERVLRDGPLDPADALATARGVLDGLVAMHAAGLVHRDVSPLNVHVAPGPVTAAGVRLLDLGLAGPAGTATVYDEPGAVGNPGYVSPEQSRGDPVDARGDVYQVGATLYLALTGRPPFGDGPADRLVAAHRSSPPPVPSVARPGLPAALDRLVVRAMLKEPGLRYASATQMRDAVRDAVDAPAAAPGTRVLPAVVVPPPPLAGVPVDLIEPPEPREASAAPRSRPGPPPPGAVRSTRGAAILGVLLVLALIGGIGWISQAGAEPAGPPPAAPVVSTTSTPTATRAPTPTTSRQTPSAAASVAVPVLAGLTTADAVAALRALGLHVGSVSQVPDPSAAQTVLASAPPAGVRVGVGSAVDLQTASGTTLVPDVRGMSAAAAEAAVRAAGLVPQTRGTGQSGVLAVSPVARSELPVGTTVTLELGDAPTPTPTATPTPTPTPWSSPTPTSSP